MIFLHQFELLVKLLALLCLVAVSAEVVLRYYFYLLFYLPGCTFFFFSLFFFFFVFLVYGCLRYSPSFPRRRFADFRGNFVDGSAALGGLRGFLRHFAGDFQLEDVVGHVCMLSVVGLRMAAGKGRLAGGGV